MFFMQFQRFLKQIKETSNFEVIRTQVSVSYKKLFLPWPLKQYSWSGKMIEFLSWAEGVVVDSGAGNPYIPSQF